MSKKVKKILKHIPKKAIHFNGDILYPPKDEYIALKKAWKKTGTQLNSYAFKTNKSSLDAHIKSLFKQVHSDWKTILNKSSKHNYLFRLSKGTTSKTTDIVDSIYPFRLSIQQNLNLIKDLISELPSDEQEQNLLELYLLKEKLFEEASGIDLLVYEQENGEKFFILDKTMGGEIVEAGLYKPSKTSLSSMSSEELVYYICPLEKKISFLEWFCSLGSFISISFSLFCIFYSVYKFRTILKFDLISRLEVFLRKG